MTAMGMLVGRDDSTWLAGRSGSDCCRHADVRGLPPEKEDGLEGYWCLLRPPAGWGGVGPLGRELLWEGTGASYLCLFFPLSLPAFKS